MAIEGLVGREAEQERIGLLLDGVPLGPVGICLTGPPGIGKTALWRNAVRLAFERDFEVLLTSPAEPDAGLTFAGLGDLFDTAVDDVTAGLPDPQRRALTAALLLEETSVAPADPQALPRAVLTAIRRRAARRPVVIAIDDEQWLDPASARVLGFALRRLRDEPVCVLLARRPEGISVLWPELVKGFGKGGPELLEITPLDLRATESLLRLDLGRTVPRPVAKRIHEVSGGNPLYAIAIARELPAGSASGDVPIPRAFTEAMTRRLRHLDPPALDPLLVTAASSAPTLSLLSSVLPDFVVSDLDSGVAAEIVEIVDEHVRFTHPLLASTLYANALPAKRREVHRAIAGVLDDEEERARHYALGAETPDPAVSLVLERAAESAARRGAPEAAADLLEQASRLTPLEDMSVRRARWITAAEMHRTSGNMARARHLLDKLLPELPPGPTRARARLELSIVTMEAPPVAVGMLDQALADAGTDYELRALIELEYQTRMQDLGRFEEMASHARKALAHAAETGDPGLHAMASAVQAAAACFTGEPVDFAALDRAIARESCLQTTTANLPSFVKAQLLFWVDDLDGARPLLDRLWQRASECGEELQAAFALLHLVGLEWFAGRHAEAKRKFVVCEAARDQGDYAFDLLLDWMEALFALGRGELTEAVRKATGVIDASTTTTFVLMEIVGTDALAQADLAGGRADAAHNRLSALRDSLVSHGFGFVGSLGLGLWTLDVEALIALGSPDEAEPILDDFAIRARRSKNPHAQAIAHRCRGLILGARGRVVEAIGEMDAALANHARRPLPPELARTLLEKACLERRAKRKSAAKRNLEAALALLEPMDAEILKARAQDELSRIGLRRATVTTGLTPAQLRVAELVVAGMSNREIATTLYMSTRSVESHLTKIYRELGVRSRAQLAASWDAGGRTLRGDSDRSDRDTATV